MRKLEYTVVVEREEGDPYLVATVLGIPGCHTQAKTMPELLKRIEKVIRLCLRADKVHPKPLKFVGLQEIRVAV